MFEEEASWINRSNLDWEDKIKHGDDEIGPNSHDTTNDLANVSV